MNMKKVPNRLSIVRIALIPVFVVLFFLPFWYLKFAALFVFVLASLTDFLDGYIARKYNATSDTGNFLDTIADKMLVVCVLIAFSVSLGMYNRLHASLVIPFIIVVAVCTMIMVSRELLISGLKMIAKTKGSETVVADKMGKIKMFVQVVALAILIPYGAIVYLHAQTGNIFLYVGLGLLILATIFSIASCINYLVKYKHLFKGKKEAELAEVKSIEANLKEENSAKESSEEGKSE